MTRKEIGQLIELAAANFPHIQNKDLKPTAMLWGEVLADIPFDRARAGVIEILLTAKYFPNMAEIREASNAPDTLNNAMEITPEQQAVYAKKYIRRKNDDS